MVEIGPKKWENRLEKAIGKWFVVNLIGNGSAYGQITQINGREITINPHKAFRYDADKKCNLYTLIGEDAYLEMSPNGYYLEPTNRETLEYVIKKQNEDILKRLNKKDIPKK